MMLLICSDKADRVLAYARELAGQVETWADFSNGLFNPFTGVAILAFPLQKEREWFIDSAQYAEINRLLVGLMDKFGLVAGATPRRPVARGPS
jgi:hypothetical protein